MRNTTTTRVAFALLAVFAVFALAPRAGVTVGAKSGPPVPSNIRLTPPAPVFTDKERIGLDAWILVKTVLVVLTRDGAS